MTGSQKKPPPASTDHPHGSLSADLGTVAAPADTEAALGSRENAEVLKPAVGPQEAAVGGPIDHSAGEPIHEPAKPIRQPIGLRRPLLLLTLLLAGAAVVVMVASTVVIAREQRRQTDQLNHQACYARASALAQLASVEIARGSSNPPDPGVVLLYCDRKAGYSN